MKMSVEVLVRNIGQTVDKIDEIEDAALAVRKADGLEEDMDEDPENSVIGGLYVLALPF